MFQFPHFLSKESVPEGHDFSLETVKFHRFSLHFTYPRLRGLYLFFP